MAAGFQRGDRGFRKEGPAKGPGFGEGLAHVLSLSQTQQQAKQEFARARRYGYPLTLALCQVDRIDSLADIYGQNSRRLLFEQSAKLFQSRSRSTDIVGRLGEDRMLWVLPHTELLGARIAADRLREAVEGLDFQSGQRNIRVTLSVGLACLADRNTLFFDSVLLQAEKALERAQNRGGNLVEEHALLCSEATPKDEAEPDSKGLE